VQISLNVVARVVHCTDGRLGLGRGDALHRTDDHTDKQVQHRECRDKDERNKKRPGVREHLHQWSHDAHRPAFKRHDLKQRVQRPTQRAKPVRKLVAKKLGCNHAKHVKQKQQHQRYGGQAGHCREQSADNPTHRRYDAQHAQHAKHAQGTQHRKGATGRNQCNRNDQEVEHVPRVAKKRAAPSNDTQADFQHEHRKHRLVE